MPYLPTKKQVLQNAHRQHHSRAEHMDQNNTNLNTPEREGAHKEGKLAWGGMLSGGILIVISIIFIVGGVQLGLGSPFRLGTGAFPAITGLILAVLAVAICIDEMRGDGLVDKPDWIGFMAICAAIAVFAASADRIGLVPGAFLTIVVASLPDRSLPFAGKAILGAVVAFASWALFIKTLNLPFKAFVGF